MTPKGVMSLAGEPSRGGAEGIQATVHSGCSLAATKLYLSELFFHLRRLTRVCFCFTCVCVCVCVCACACMSAVLRIYQLGATGQPCKWEGGHGARSPLAWPVLAGDPCRCCCSRRTTGHLLCSQHSLPRPIFNWKLSQQWDTRAPDGTASCHLNVN